MSRMIWRANSAGAYWIDIAVGQVPLQWMVDTGLTDPRDEIGFALDPAMYQQLKHNLQLTRFRSRLCRDASGRYATVETAETSAQLWDVSRGQPVGPQTRLFVSHGASGVPNRVGVAFFHHLSGCRVDWDFSARTWAIEYS